MPIWTEDLPLNGTCGSVLRLKARSPSARRRQIPRRRPQPPSLLHDHGYALAGGQRGMEITVQITIKSQAGEPERIQQAAHLQRGTLQPDTLGLSLAEARSILAGLEQTMAQRQARPSLPRKHAVAPMRPGACLQGPPYGRVPHPFW